MDKVDPYEGEVTIEGTEGKKYLVFTIKFGKSLLGRNREERRATIKMLEVAAAAAEAEEQVQEQAKAHTTLPPRAPPATSPHATTPSIRREPLTLRRPSRRTPPPPPPLARCSCRASQSQQHSPSASRLASLGALPRAPPQVLPAVAVAATPACASAESEAGRRDS